MKHNITENVRYLNCHLNDNDFKVCKWLTDYIHSSDRYEKICYPDNYYVSIQPSWPNETVVGYRYYSDYEMTYAHKTNRFMLTFGSNHEYDISVYKFKRYLRRKNNLYDNKRKSK